MAYFSSKAEIEELKLNWVIPFHAERYSDGFLKIEKADQITIIRKTRG